MLAQGSLVDPEKLRFDVRQGKQINVAELEKIELIVQDAIGKKQAVFSQEATLEAAKPIVGLRTLAGEAYPNPVRVVSVGTDVAYLLANPTGPESLQTSVEFCGGTCVLGLENVVSVKGVCLLFTGLQKAV
jgi:alanyl-tRNA synthetase